MLKLLVVLSVILIQFGYFNSAMSASCGVPKFTPSENVKLTGDKVMIVTHPSTQWDGQFSSKFGMDAAVKFAKKQKIPVIYLEDSNSYNADSYFFADCKPDYWVASGGGEFSFGVPVSHVYTVGGHWEMCQAGTMSDLMHIWAAHEPRDLTITQVMDGLYTAGEHFRSSDSYYARYKAFMDVVTYGHPDDWPFPKLNLLESMGIIQNIDAQIEFLTRELPPYHLLSSIFQVEMYLNGKLVRILQKSKDKKFPTLKIEFVDSLYVSGEPIPSSIPKGKVK